MAPKLYMTELSPPVRAVLLCEKALGIKLEYVLVDFSKEENLKPEFVKTNPQHTVPTLEEDDGTVIWDSHAIMSYLVGKYGKNDSLYPKDLKKRALVDQRMHFETGNVFSVLRSIVVSLRTKKADSVTEEYKALVESAYEFLDRFLQGNHWVAGKDVTIADFSLVSSISSGNIMVPIDAKYKNIHAWLKRMEALPYYDANAKGLAGFKTFFASLLKK